VSTTQELRTLVNQECNALLAAQVATLCSSDARATGLLAAAATIAGIAFAAVAAIWTNADLKLLSAGCWGAAILASGAAGVALWAVWPTPLMLPGWGPADFEGDTAKTTEEIVAEMLTVNQQKIDSNNVLIDAMHRRSLLAVVLLAYTPLSALAGALCTMGSMALGVALLIWLGVLVILFVFFVPKQLRTPR
jgi:hypothetical protein